VSLKFNDGVIILPIIALMRFETAIYFEFERILKKADPVNTINYGVYSALDNFKEIDNVDLLQIKLNSKRGYYIFKIETSDEIRCYSRLDDYFTLNKIRET